MYPQASASESIRCKTMENLLELTREFNVTFQRTGKKLGPRELKLGLTHGDAPRVQHFDTDDLGRKVFETSITMPWHKKMRLFSIEGKQDDGQRDLKTTPYLSYCRISAISIQIGKHLL